MISATVWVVSGLATLLWLHVVFKRYETTLALLIEYGAVQVCAVCSGLIFYREAQTMAGWQLGLCVSGCVVILLGIAIGRLPEPTIGVVSSTDSQPLDVETGNRSRVPSPPPGRSADALTSTSLQGVTLSPRGSVLFTTEADRPTCRSPAAVRRPDSEPLKRPLPSSPLPPSFTLCQTFNVSPSPKLRGTARDFSPLVPELPTQSRTLQSTCSSPSGARLQARRFASPTVTSSRRAMAQTRHARGATATSETIPSLDLTPLSTSTLSAIAATSPPPRSYLLSMPSTAEQLDEDDRCSSDEPVEENPKGGGSDSAWPPFGA